MLLVWWNHSLLERHDSSLLTGAIQGIYEVAVWNLADHLGGMAYPVSCEIER